MISEFEFRQWCNKLELTETTIKMIERIRASEPSRSVKGGFNNVIGAYPSEKMKKTIHFESHTVELPGIYIKENDENVLEYYDQPPQIQLSYQYHKKEKVIKIFHTPDFFVMHKNCAGWEEWKPEEKLIELSEKSPNRYILIDGHWHCPPGEAYANQFGLQYWVKSSKDINWVLYRNLIFLEDYYLENHKR